MSGKSILSPVNPSEHKFNLLPIIIKSHLSDKPNPTMSGTTTHECWDSAGITFCHACKLGLVCQSI